VLIAAIVVSQPPIVGPSEQPSGGR